MNCDISLVVFKPHPATLLTTLASVGQLQGEFRTLRILVSGSKQDHILVSDIVREVGLGATTEVLHRYDNLGFATGHNLLLDSSFVEDADFCLVLNPDIRVTPGSLSALIQKADSDGGINLYGPALRQLVPDASEVSSKMDSMGVRWTASGRHFDVAQGMDVPKLSGAITTVRGLTGACLLVPRESYRVIVDKCGYFFDDLFLAYREDAELGIRANSLGIKSRLIEIEGFAHVRTIRGSGRGNKLPDLLGVRNRFLLKWRLGKHRPGNLLVANLRDWFVIAAVLLWERSSLPGLQQALRTRRYVRMTAIFERNRT